MKFVALAALLAATIAPAHSEELFFDCQFEEVKMPGADPDAKAWLDDFSFRRRKFVYQTDPPKVLDGPGLTSPDSFWGEPQITVSKQDIEFEWRIKAKPLDRTPVLRMKVNRFSGKALESYSMLKGPNIGPLQVNWARSGKCEIYRKKV